MTSWLFGLTEKNKLFGLSTDGVLVELVDGVWIKPVDALTLDDWRYASNVDESDLKKRFNAELPHID